MGEAASSDAEGRVSQPLSRVLVHQAPGWQAQRESAFIARFIVISPQLERKRRWETEDASWIDALVRSALREHGGDETRLTLSGFSLGGEGVFTVAHASTLRWSSLWAVDPAVRRAPSLPAPETRVWIHHGKWARQEIERLPALLSDLGSTAWRGDFAARRVVTELDEDHESTCKTAFSTPVVYDWLLRGGQ